MDSALYWVWLADALGSGCAQAGQLLADWPDPRALYEAVCAGKALPGYLTRRAVEALLATGPADYAPRLERCRRAGIAVLTPEDPDYPARFAPLPDRPLALYATGDTRCLNGGRYVGMVGTRRPTQYGKQACHDLSLALAQQGVVIVSGLADGLDSEGHRAAVEAGTATVAFLGTPIDTTYPAANAALRRDIERLGGCVVSEYPPGFDKKQTATFLARNRLIAALGEALCVAEARQKSGTLNTVAHARRYGRPVLAVPGSIYSQNSAGTNALLKAGRAAMLTAAADVLAVLGMEKRDAAAPAQRPGPDTGALTAPAQTVLAALDQTPRPVDDIVRRCGLPAGTVLAALLELELSGAAQSWPGQRYTAV